MSETKVIVLAASATVILASVTATVLHVMGASPGTVILAGSVIGVGAYIGICMAFKSREFERME